MELDEDEEPEELNELGLLLEVLGIEEDGKEEAELGVDETEVGPSDIGPAGPTGVTEAEERELAVLEGEVGGAEDEPEGREGDEIGTPMGAGVDEFAIVEEKKRKEKGGTISK